MSPEELAAFMARHGLDDAKISKTLGVSLRTVRAYMESSKPVPIASARLLFLLYGEAKPEDYR